MLDGKLETERGAPTAGIRGAVGSVAIFLVLFAMAVTDLGRWAASASPAEVIGPITQSMINPERLVRPSAQLPIVVVEDPFRARNQIRSGYGRMKLSRFGIFTCGKVFASITSFSPMSLLRLRM